MVDSARESYLPTGQTATSFRLPNSAFVPGLIDPSCDRVESNTQADADMARNHSQTYQSLGRVGGYLEVATWGAIEFTYMGSAFTNATAASNALREGLRTTALMVDADHTPEGCANVYHVACSIQPYKVAAGSNGTYFVLQYNQCLVEIRTEGLPAPYLQGRDVILQTAKAILQGGYTVASKSCRAPTLPPPASVDFSVIVARAERVGAAPDFSLTSPGLTRTRIGTPVNLAVYFTVRRVPGNSKALASFTVRRGTGVRFYVQRGPQALPTVPGEYRMTVTYTPRATGKDTLFAQVSIDGVTQNWTTAITIAP